ncbi:aminopeptidase P family protein [Patescibacteria group bacterium]|nr:aminopeptidase P family protein [Patescibacteria group bacterium]
MNNTFQNRINKLRERIENNQSLLLSSSSDITYYTDFNFLLPEEREAFAFITKNSASLIHTSFSPIGDYPFIDYLKGSYPNQLANHIEKIIDKEKIEEILIDAETLFVAELNAIKEKFTDLKVNNCDTAIIQNFRNIKEPVEIEQIKKACIATALVIEEIKNELFEGITEYETKIKIDKLIEKHGADGLAFPTIIAFGSNSALPHHQPNDKKLENNMAVLIDMGTKVSGYCSDMTRTFWFGNNPSKKFLEIEKIVRAAYQATFEKLKKPTIKAKDLDNAARALISNKGYAEKFVHTTGHGLGLSIHEQPSISWSNVAEIYPNMTITIEPGIYLENEFGYRYENTVLVTEDGAVELTLQD